MRCRVLAWIHAAVSGILPSHGIRKSNVDLAKRIAVCGGSHVNARSEKEAVYNYAHNEDVHQHRDHKGIWSLVPSRGYRKK
jgi:hypothetical protein